MRLYEFIRKFFLLEIYNYFYTFIALMSTVGGKIGIGG